MTLPYTLPYTPTQRYLASLGACHDAREWVGKRTLRQAWLTCERLDWLQWLLCAPARAEYERTISTAWAEYERTISTPRAEYERTISTAWAEYERTISTAWAEYERTRATTWAEYERATAPAWAEYQRATAPARAEYQRATAPINACATCDEIRSNFKCPSTRKAKP